MVQILATLAFLTYFFAQVNRVRSACCTDAQIQFFKAVRTGVDAACTLVSDRLVPTLTFEECIADVNSGALAAIVASAGIALPEGIAGALAGDAICVAIYAIEAGIGGFFCERIKDDAGALAGACSVSDCNAPPQLFIPVAPSCGSPPLDDCTSQFCGPVCSSFRNPSSDPLASCTNLPSCLKTDAIPWATDLFNNCDPSSDYFLDGYSDVCCCSAPAHPSPTSMTSVITPTAMPSSICDNCTSLFPGLPCCLSTGITPTCTCGVGSGVGSSADCSAGEVFCPA
jgi:hypothetical protein